MYRRLTRRRYNGRGRRRFRTRTYRKPVFRRAGARRYNFRRRRTTGYRLRRRYGRRGRNPLANFSMRPGLGPQVLRFHNITEVQYTWVLTYASPATTPQKMMTMDMNYMPPPGRNPLQEAAFSSFESARLAKFTWKADNFRLFMETDTSELAVGTLPAQHEVDIKELKQWKLWYFRQQTHVHSAAPPADAEERFQKFLIWNSKSKVWGSVPIPMKGCSWISKSYAQSFDPSTGAYKTLYDYLNNVATTSYKAGAATDDMPTGAIWLMPDDPLPKDSYGQTGANVTRTVKLTLVVDVHSYTTWHMLKQIVA